MSNLTEEAQKREIKNRRHFSFRLNVFFFITFFVFSVLIVRLAYLQFVEGDSLRAREHEIGTRPVAVPPIRGNIYDSEKRALAYSTSTQSLYYTHDTKMSEEDGKALAAELVAKFNELGLKTAKPLTVEEVFKYMDFKGRVYYSYQPRRIKSGLTKEEIAYFSEHKDQFPGIEVVEESVRQYDKDRVAVQLVGYMKKMSGATSLSKYKDAEKQTDKTLEYLKDEEVGFDGLEFMYQDELRGRNGIKEYPVNNQSEIIGPMKLTKPIKGDNIILTINKDIQLATQNAITEHLEKIRTSSDKQERAANAKTGYAVAMEVKTGKVVAMASMPDYDPAVWQGGISQDDLDSITYYMSNGAIRDAQPPYKDDKERMKHPSSLVNLGSTQKPLTILVGLNEKLITTQSEFIDPGYFAFGGKGHETRVRNASSAANGLLKPVTAIAKSSNAYMAGMIGNRLYMRDGSEGVDIWDSYMKQFGLGVTTGSGLPLESSGIIDYFKEIKTGSAQSALIYASFGQQAKYSALQLAQYASTLASHGKRMKPQFVDRIEDTDGNIVQPYQSEVLNTVSFPDSYWQTIEAGMAQVRVRGFDDFKYNFYRKTGTSQQDVGGKTVENAVFIAYAPAENPTLAVAVVVPEGGYGGWGAAPIARKIFDAYDAKVGLDGKPHPNSVSSNPANGEVGEPFGVNAVNANAQGENANGEQQ
ncbi:peptidoglycan D,D-transpeptidase FtsI family protein [Cohnella herbarum]|uniref:Penicillin-binding protein 2 n=1 Tax=Cohnella herbarum TaxID=2728023 RepID=A0A7Z2ZLR3_9BACL|nr:penicillin-binding transpeptidase domain-containing protein [Cohnella herbarum]QJD84169.1 penicillin-binding protein 2 [Cohnella herbarum]